MLQKKFENKQPGSEHLDAGQANEPSDTRRQDFVAHFRARLGQRHVLLMLGPLVVFLGVAYFVLTGGRSVSTNNAYVKSDNVMIAAEVSGAIVDVLVRENQHVEKGDLIFQIDDREYLIALTEAEAQLASVRDEIASLKASYHQHEEELVLVRSDVVFAEKEFERQKQLVARNAVSQSKYDSTSHDVDQARQQMHVIEQELAQTRAQLAGNPDIPVNEHPRFLAAQAVRDRVALDLEHTKVYAPLSGVASHIPDYGQWVTGSSLLVSPIMNIVGDQYFWIEANLKETQLANVRQGQPVSIEIDAFPGHEWSGRVESISWATGAEFSVIPAQNASGNWVKVVQRIPVRITVDSGPDQLSLRSGLSASVSIDTTIRNQPAGLAHNAAQLGGTERGVLEDKMHTD